MRATGIVVAGILAVARTGAAQLPSILPAGSYVRDVSYPKIFYTTKEGLAGGLYFALQAPLSFQDFDLPPPYRASLTIDGQVTTSGSRQVILDARAPLLFDGWRLALTLAAERHTNESYFGIGNDAVFNKANQAGRDAFYRSENKRTYARAEVQRRVVGGLRVLVGMHWESARISTADSVSQLATDSVAGVDPTIGRPTGDVSWRAGLVFDTRDDEIAPSSGVLIEAIRGGADSAFAGSQSYTRTTVSARAYVPVGERFILAARTLGQSMSGSPTLTSYYLVEASDRPFDGLGGPLSHRGLLEHRLLGPDKLLANFDVRYALFEVPTLIRLSLVGFVDAGRVFPTEGFRLTTDSLKVGAGGGLMLKIQRAGMLGISFAGGPDGLIINAHTSWTF